MFFQESLELWQKIVTLSTGQIETQELINLYEVSVIYLIGR